MYSPWCGGYEKGERVAVYEYKIAGTLETRIDVYQDGEHVETVSARDIPLAMRYLDAISRDLKHAKRELARIEDEQRIALEAIVQEVWRIRGLSREGADFR